MEESEEEEESVADEEEESEEGLAMAGANRQTIISVFSHFLYLDLLFRAIFGRSSLDLT